MKEITKIQKRVEKRIKEDVIACYNSYMPQIYKDYRQIPSDEIRLLALAAITEHILGKTRLALQRKQRIKAQKPVAIDQTNLEPVLESF